MSKHSRHSMRMLLVRAGLAVLMLLVALPRITVHSHATLAGSGIDATTLSNHIQLFHSTSANDIPFDAPHLHWQWNSVVSTIPSATPELVGVEHSAPTDWTIASVYLHACLSLDNPLDSLASVPTGDCPENLLKVGPTNRVLFCVWNC